TKQCDRFFVQTIEQAEHIVLPLGQVGSVRHVARWAVVDGLRPNVALGHGYVADEISEREHAIAWCPLDAIRGNAFGDSSRPLANVVEVFQEAVHCSVHVAPRRMDTCDDCFNRRRFSLSRLELSRLRCPTPELDAETLTSEVDSHYGRQILPGGKDQR